MVRGRGGWREGGEKGMGGGREGGGERERGRVGRVRRDGEKERYRRVERGMDNRGEKGEGE